MLPLLIACLIVVAHHVSRAAGGLARAIRSITAAGRPAPVSAEPASDLAERRRRRRAPRRRSGVLPALLGLGIALTVFGSGYALLSPDADEAPPERAALAPRPTVAAQPAVSRQAPSCVPAPPYSQSLAAIVEADLADEVGTYGVAILHTGTGEAYLRNGDRRFPAASVYKLSVLYEARRQIEVGKLSPTAKLTILPEDALEPEPEGGPQLGATLSVAEAMEAMVTISSNVSARALLRTVGREAVNDSMRSLGLRETMVPAPNAPTGVVDADGEPVATTSPRDALCFLTQLARGQLISTPASVEMRDRLLRQRINDRLPALLPSGVRVAHKTGDLSGVRNDVGIVYAPEGVWVVAVLTEGVDEPSANAAIAGLSRHLYDHFTLPAAR